MSSTKPLTSPTGAPLDKWFCNVSEKYDRTLDPDLKPLPKFEKKPPTKSLSEIIKKLEAELNTFWDWPDEFYPTAMLRRNLHCQIRDLKRLQETTTENARSL